MAILNTQDKSSLVFVLTAPSIQLKGTHLKETDSLQFINSTRKHKLYKICQRPKFARQCLICFCFFRASVQKPTFVCQTKKVLKQLEKEQNRLQKEDTNL